MMRTAHDGSFPSSLDFRLRLKIDYTYVRTHTCLPLVYCSEYHHRLLDLPLPTQAISGSRRRLSFLSILSEIEIKLKMSGKVGNKRRIQEAIEFANHSIKNMKIHHDNDIEIERTSSRDGSQCSGLLPPIIVDEERDANYEWINPILREAHYLRKLRVSQKVIHFDSNGMSENMEIRGHIEMECG